MKNLYLRGRVWWAKKMIRGVLVCRSLETSDQEEAFRKMDRVITADYIRQISPPGKTVSQVDPKVLP